MIKVGVFFGGRSVEHEVSVITALEAMYALDREKYEVVPVYISKEGQFYTGEELKDISSYKNINDLYQRVRKINIEVNKGLYQIVSEKGGLFGKKVIETIDIAFPIMHGTNGEDGTIQGLFELMDIPYVGCDVLSSANGMDKITMKMILKENKIPVIDYVWFYSKEYYEDENNIVKKVEKELTYPVIVKPANLGSSVGISRANNKKELKIAIEEAIVYSKRIIVEKMVENLQEINCSVLGDYESQEASVCEEPVRSEEILTYKDKYMSSGKGNKTGGKGMSTSWSDIPAKISEDLTKKIQELAKNTFKVLDASGVSRIDFMVDKKTKDVYVNEINTIPGSLSFYLWDATDKKYNILLDELIELSLKKYREKSKLVFTNDVNILEMNRKGGTKGIKGGQKIRK